MTTHDVDHSTCRVLLCSMPSAQVVVSMADNAGAALRCVSHQNGLKDALYAEVYVTGRIDTLVSRGRRDADRDNAAAILFV